MSRIAIVSTTGGKGVPRDTLLVAGRNEGEDKWGQVMFTTVL